jgi:PEP-CTERM motif-containing protein
MKRILMSSLVMLAIWLALGGAAMADSVGPTPDGFGGTFTLTDSCVGTVCSVTLTINTTGSTEPFIDAVAFKLGSGATDVGTLTLAPNGAINWDGSLQSLNSGGSCGTINKDAQVCYYDDGNLAGDPQQIGVATGGILTWTWTGVDVKSGTDIAHVGYQYNTGAGTNFNGLIVSCDFTNDVSTNCGGTSVPEPSSLSMLGAGLLALCGFARRRFLNS